MMDRVLCTIDDIVNYILTTLLRRDITYVIYPIRTIMVDGEIDNNVSLKNPSPENPCSINNKM